MTVIKKNGRKLFEAELADSLAAKMIGLMFRRKLHKNKGMLFSFPLDHRWSFWMFGMKFSLDILFMNKKGKIMHIERNVKPFSADMGTWKMIKPRSRFRHALEINAGEAKNKRIKVGDVLTFKEWLQEKG